MNRFNKYAARCAHESELIAYKNGSLPAADKEQLSEHLLLCDRCALALDLLPSAELEYAAGENDAEAEQIPLALLEAFEKYQRHIAAEPKTEPKSLKDFLKNKEELKVGQIWRTKLEKITIPTAADEAFSVSQLGSIPHFVVITNPFVENLWAAQGETGKPFRVIKVVPVTDNVEFAADGDDIILSETENPLGYPLMMQIWNQREMFLDNLDACMGEVSAAPAAFKSVSANETTSLIDFLVEKGRMQISDTESDFSFYGLIKKGVYSDPAMRFRAMSTLR